MHKQISFLCYVLCGSTVDLTMTTTNSGVSVTVLLSVLCLGLAMMFVGGWYFQSSLVELKEQQQETAQVVQQLKEKVQ